MNEPVVAVPIAVPIVAVSVYPDRARITRRGTVRLVAGDQVVHVEPLPLGLHPDSVRVSGRGPATVLGVDVVTRHHPSTPDERAAPLEDERHTILAEIDELADADDVQLKLDAFHALKYGKFEQSNDLLAKAAEISKDPQVQQMSTWVKQFESQRQEFATERHKQFGPSLLHRYLPFWAATLVERLIIVLVPLLVILVPVMNYLPQVLRWRVVRGLSAAHRGALGLS